jgi:hypothetical protein
MNMRIFRNRGLRTCLFSALALTTPHCVTDNNIDPLKELVASTAGSLVQILVAGRLESVTPSDSPDTGAPISQQYH